MVFLIRLAAVVFGVAVIGASSVASASGAFEIDLNDRSVRASLTTRAGAAGYDVDFGIIHDSDRGEAYQAGLHYAGFAGTGGQVFEVSIGGRMILVDSDAGSGAGLAIGGALRYRIPSRERFWLSADARIAPSVLAFGDAKEIFAVGIGAEYRVLDRAAIQLRYGQLHAEFDDGNTATLDRGLHLGFRLEF